MLISSTFNFIKLHQVYFTTDTNSLTSKMNLFDLRVLTLFKLNFITIIFMCQQKIKQCFVSFNQTKNGFWNVLVWRRVSKHFFLNLKLNSLKCFYFCLKLWRLRLRREEPPAWQSDRWWGTPDKPGKHTIKNRWSQQANINYYLLKKFT